MKKCLIMFGLYLLAGMVTCRILPFAFAEGETDPLWAKPCYEKKLVKVGQRLLQRNNISDMISFTLIHDVETVNAEARDDYNQVRVYSGLLRLLDSDDELAAVLGHEISHILNRDTLKTRVASNTIGNTLAILGGALLATNPYDGGYYAHKIKTMTDRQIVSFSQDRELAADSRGLDLMVTAGYNPLAMESILQKIVSDGYVLRFFRSHPLGSTRLKRIHEQIVTKYPQFLTSTSAATTTVTQPVVNASNSQEE